MSAGLGSGCSSSFLRCDSCGEFECKSSRRGCCEFSRREQAGCALSVKNVTDALKRFQLPPMVLHCDRCGKKFWLMVGEQEWLEKHAVRARQNRCVECAEYSLEYPVAKTLETRGGKIRLHTEQRNMLQRWRIPDAAKRLPVPVPRLGADHASILWQRFRLGNTTINRLREHLAKGDTNMCLDPSERLPHGPLGTGTTITVSHVTRNLVFWDREKSRGMIDSPFPSWLRSGTEYSIFRSADIDGLGLPTPLCLDDHNIEKKRARESEASQKLAFAQQMARSKLRDEQSRTVLDTWGPPCKAEDGHLSHSTKRRSRFNCQVFASAVERFAHRGNSLISYPDKTIRTITLACHMGLHEGLGATSVLYLLHDDPDLLSLIISFAFSEPALPKWQLLKPISDAISSRLSRPCGILVVNMGDLAASDQKTKDRLAQRRKQQRPSPTLSRWRRRSQDLEGDGKQRFDTIGRLGVFRSTSSTSTMASPVSAAGRTGSAGSRAKSPLSESFLGASDEEGGAAATTGSPPLASSPVPPRQEGLNLKAHVKSMMNLRMNQMAVSHALKREVAKRPELLLVCDDEEGCVKVFLGDGHLDRTIGKGVVRVPGGVAVTTDGDVLVTDMWLHKVHVFNLQGKFSHEFGGFGARPGLFSCPRGIAAGRDGRIYVCDSHNHRVQLFTREGTLLGGIGSHGGGAGQLDEPACVAVDAQGRVAVSEVGNARVQLFDANGQSLDCVKALKWGDDAPAEAFLEADQSGTVEELGMPMGLCFTAEGSLWVTDLYFHRILLLDRDMHPLHKFGSGGGWGAVQSWTEPFRTLRTVGLSHLGLERHAPVGGDKVQELSGPAAVGISSSGRVYVADSENFRVQVYI